MVSPLDFCGAVSRTHLAQLKSIEDLFEIVGTEAPKGDLVAVGFDRLIERLISTRLFDQGVPEMLNDGDESLRDYIWLALPEQPETYWLEFVQRQNTQTDGGCGFRDCDR